MTGTACRIPGTPLAITLVAGCRSTEVMRVAYHADQGVWLRSRAEVVRAIGEAHTSPFLLPVAGQASVVSLWRHPVARFAALRRRVNHEPERSHYQSLHGLGGVGWGRLLDYVRWELGKSDPAAMDEAVRPQVVSWTPDLVERAVRVEHLPRLLRPYGVATDVLGLVLRPPRPLPRVPHDVASVVMRLYADDLSLVEAVRP